MLPPLYEMDDFERCIQNGYIYCKVVANLQSTVNYSEVWRHIQNSLTDKRKFQRNVLYRALCIPTHSAHDELYIKQHSEMLVNERIKELNLTSLNDVVACTDGSIPRNSFDYIVLFSVISYCCFIIFATLRDLRTENIEGDGGLLRKFSLGYNWRKRTKLNKNEDYQNLKSMQGLRFYTIMTIIFVHTKLSYILTYVKNPSTLEELLSHPLFYIINVADIFLVHIFFLMSSWLLTLQICRIFAKHDGFSFKHAASLIINRYLRTAVTLGVLIAFYCTTWLSFLQGPNNFELCKSHQLACSKNWHTTLFFISNFHYVGDMCNGISWYLSADFQMYILNTLILFVIFKFNLNMKKIFSLVLLISCSIYGTMMYIYDMDIIFKPIIGNFENGRFFRSLSFIITYTSTFSIWSSSCVGMILGALYFSLKNDKDIQRNKLWTYSWPSLFLGLPLMAILLSSMEFRRIEAAILGSLVKPVFALGIGAGLLGMSKQNGGVIKKLFEWEPIVMLSNFTYGIYICHFSFSFVKYSPSPVTFGVLELLEDYLKNVLISLALGIILTLTIEEPGITLQKILLPQVEKYGERSRKKTK